MKKIILYIIAMLVSHIMAVSAIATCPFTYTVYIIDGDHTYDWGIPFRSLASGYPAMPRVLAIEPLREINPYNTYVLGDRDKHGDFFCYWKNYGTTRCHYFTISESPEACQLDKAGQSTSFRVIIGTEKSTPTYWSEGLPNLKESRSGRNCVFTVRAGPNENLTLTDTPSCTHNIQFDDPSSLNLDKSTGSGDYVPASNIHGDLKHKIDSDYYCYPTFSTPKN